MRTCRLHNTISDLLFIGQSELRSSFEPLLSALEILQFGLRSCSGNSLQPSNHAVVAVVPLESHSTSIWIAYFKAFMHFMLALLVGVGLTLFHSLFQFFFACSTLPPFPRYSLWFSFLVLFVHIA